MIVDQLKLIYLPIAKNACSSTKRLVASLGGLTPENGQDIHYMLDKNNTGLQFKDRKTEDLTRAFAARDWMRFIIFRDPMDRLVSAYVEKFVNNRTYPDQWATCRHVIETVFEKRDPTPEDYAHGVTFREFAEYILAHDPQQLDSHWQPQTFYMGHVPLTHMYDVKALDQFEQDLRDHIGADITLPRMNVSRETETDLTDLPTAVDLLPADLPDAKSLSLHSFLPEDLRARLMEFYAADVSIYRQIQRASGTATDAK
ncbi:sulfotransferase family 2 domain-containing protein [Marivita hallyeonensis]|nr:sulfotransferase family 2 domain-containing protein [Marivita hallyeonensis]